jgi:putative peptidoglycan lipid II flippase
MRLTLFAAVPATLLAVTLSEPLVVLLFQRGHFDAISAHETARALVAQGAGIWLVALCRQLVSLYYAVGDTRTPVVIAAIDLGAFITLALLLCGPLGHVGVSAAVSGASAVQASLLWWRAKRHLEDRRGGEIAVSFARTLAASVASAVFAHTVLRGLTALGLGAAICGLVAACAGVVAFVVSAALLRSSELGVLTKPLARRFSSWRGRGPSA